MNEESPRGPINDEEDDSVKRKTLRALVVLGVAILAIWLANTVIQKREQAGYVDSKTAVMTKTVPWTYADLYRYNELYVGKYIFVEGRVLQIINNRQFRIATQEDPWLGVFTEGVLFVDGYNGVRLMVGDYLMFYAMVTGLITYEALLGKITIPKVRYIYGQIYDW